VHTSGNSFIDIFDNDFQINGKSVRLNKIVIPSIQRDYAQGRLDFNATRVRKRFLQSLYNAITGNPTTLDFIYGDIDADGTLTPLDGQQRLTTLFLLHWYAAKKENIREEEWVFLKGFGYETRYSARDFCVELVKYTPGFEQLLSEEIIDQAWFPLDWKKDSTINSMLTMLDAIDEVFKDVTNIWEALKNNSITFHFLPIKDMGLTDELYIKMNSRGKPLTLFEHFKAELERELRAVDDVVAARIINKIDLKWTDLLWAYRNSDVGAEEDNIIDDEFLRYFKFICDIIYFKKLGIAQKDENIPNPKRVSDEFELVEEYFSVKSNSLEEVKSNIALLENYFDCWCDIVGFNSPTVFLESVFAKSHEDNKVLSDDIDIFSDCIKNYGQKRTFTLSRFALFYAIICYLLNQNNISKEDFVRRLRIVNNLIQNSKNEIADRNEKDGKNRIPYILQQIEMIILKGTIDDSIGKNFNANQLAEEKTKITHLKKYPEDAQMLFRLEDHYLLEGQISIIGLENINYGNRFASLFQCDWDLVNCALMSVGNYRQREGGKSRYQVGSCSLQYAWKELFHRSANTGFEKTRKALLDLLASQNMFTDDILKKTAESFLLQCEQNQLFSWEYYFVKYPAFRPDGSGSYGKIWNDKPDAEPYMYSVLQTQKNWSSNTYMPFLKAAGGAHEPSRDHFGQRLVFKDVYIVCENASYIVRKNETDEDVDTILISQNEAGIDTEDRVIKLKNYIATI